MIDGTYQMQIQTPMGFVPVNVTLKTNGNKLSGILEGRGIKEKFENGIVNGNRLNFKGNFSTMFGKIEYDVNGEVNGNILKVIANTNKGNIKLEGKRKL